jgi:hypothetical protein
LHLQLAELLVKRITKNNHNFKRPSNIDSWADQVRLMMENDNRTYEQIESVIDWCQKDPFWQSNILSVKKLREKFDQLDGKMKQNRLSMYPIKQSKREQQLDELERIMNDYDRGNEQKNNGNVFRELS